MMCRAPAMTYRRDIESHWVSAYLLARESYDPATIEVALWVMASLTAPGADVDDHQPCDPFNACDETMARTEVEVTSVAFSSDFEAIVRFATWRIDAKGLRRERTGSWVATVGYRYGALPVAVEDRRFNPWGLYITSYRVRPALMAVGSLAAIEDRP